MYPIKQGPRQIFRFRTLFVTSIVAIACCGFHSGARAEIVFDNFGPGNSFDSLGSVIGFVDGMEQGGVFQVSGGSYALDSVDTSLSYVTGVNEVTLSLYSTSGGIPDALIESVTQTGLPDHFGGPFSPTTFFFSGSSILEDGESYALVASTATTDDMMIWNFNDTGDTGVVSRQLGSGWTYLEPDPTPAFRVNGSAVPEPGSLAIVAGLFATSVGLRRRQGDTSSKA